MQNRLKAHFIQLYLVFLTVAIVHSAMALSRGVSLAWIGALLPAATGMGFMGYFVGLRKARTDAAPWLVELLSALGALLSVVGYLREPALGPWPLLYGTLGALSVVAYLRWYSRFGREKNSALVVGAPLPSFELKDEQGRVVKSEELLQGPAVLLFYRGNWCPLCMAQIREVAALYRDLEARGCTVALISGQSEEHTRSLAKRFDAPFRFLVDADLSVARRLGIFHERGVMPALRLLGYDDDTVFPTVVVVGADRRVLMVDQTDNYRVRPEPDVFLAVLDAAS